MRFGIRLWIFREKWWKRLKKQRFYWKQAYSQGDSRVRYVGFNFVLGSVELEMVS